MATNTWVNIGAGDRMLLGGIAWTNIDLSVPYDSF